MEYNGTQYEVVEGPYIDRDFSWLQFNERVLACADNPKVPLNERFKFLGITSSNLDEFISVRYSRPMMYDNELDDELLKKINKFIKKQNKIYKTLSATLSSVSDKGLSKVEDLKKKSLDELEDIFENKIFPLLTPISVGITQTTPNLPNGCNAIAVTIAEGNNENLVIIPILNLDKLYKTKNNYVTVEDMILHFIDKLFINKSIISKGYFKLIKDASTYYYQKSNSKVYIDRLSDAIVLRDNLDPIFMYINKDMPDRLKSLLLDLFDLDNRRVAAAQDVVDYGRFKSFNILTEKHSYKPFEPNKLEVIGGDYTIFQAIKKDDILLNHPFDSYDTVVKFIEDAAMDNDVIAIKQTIYRVSSEDSPIINALCRAARRGKVVTAMIELKARADEKRNLAIVDKLEDAGVNILFGKEYLKTHCKMCMVVRKEKGKLVTYSHVGTGNYNEMTSKFYTDISYFTCKKKIGQDLTHIFNIISGISSPNDDLKKVIYAPVNLRSTLLTAIDTEIENALQGLPASIFIKVNAINDPQIIDRLYLASKNKVKVYIICRGACSMLPINKNITIKSIVGRFLEHSRIYRFQNNDDPDYYIGSSDLLVRNLDRRIEILVKMKEEEPIKTLESIITSLMLDTANSFVLDSEGNYQYTNGGADCHAEILQGNSKKLKLNVKRKKKKKK